MILNASSASVSVSLISLSCFPRWRSVSLARLGMRLELVCIALQLFVFFFKRGVAAGNGSLLFSGGIELHLHFRLCRLVAVLVGSCLRFRLGGAACALSLSLAAADAVYPVSAHAKLGFAELLPPHLLRRWFALLGLVFHGHKHANRPRTDLEHLILQAQDVLLVGYDVLLCRAEPAGDFNHDFKQFVSRALSGARIGGRGFMGNLRSHSVGFVGAGLGV